VLIPELQDYVIIQICCGSRHSLALSDWGQVLSWGDNDCGQLGHATDKEIVQLPKVVRQLVTKTVVQIACGNNHSLALTSCKYGVKFNGFHSLDTQIHIRTT